MATTTPRPAPATPSPSPAYDLFVSYAHHDADWVHPLADALTDHGLRVWIDRHRLDDFASITRGIRHGLASAKALLACYSATYPTRPACQWELTYAFVAASRLGDPRRRILVVTPQAGPGHLDPADLDPVELRDALYVSMPVPADPAALTAIARRVADRVAGLDGPLGAIGPLVPPRWLPTQGTSSIRFVGRQRDLWRVHSALHATDPTIAAVTGLAGPPVAQVRGLGGIGKTLLAEQYALRFAVAYPGGVFWLRAYARVPQLMSSSSTRIGGLTCENAAVEVRCVCY